MGCYKRYLKKKQTVLFHELVSLAAEKIASLKVKLWLFLSCLSFFLEPLGCLTLFSLLVFLIAFLILALFAAL